MAWSNGALSVEDVLAASGGMQALTDVLSTLLQDALQDLIEAEVTARLGAGRWERSDERTEVRNGSRARTVATPAGDAGVRIPKLRKGSFFPDMLEPRRRIDRAPWGVVMVAYVTGTSARRSMIWSRRLGARRAYRSRRCRESVRVVCQAGGTTRLPRARDHFGRAAGRGVSMMGSKMVLNYVSPWGRSGRTSGSG